MRHALRQRKWRAMDAARPPTVWMFFKDGSFDRTLRDVTRDPVVAAALQRHHSPRIDALVDLPVEGPRQAPADFRDRSWYKTRRGIALDHNRDRLHRIVGS